MNELPQNPTLKDLQLHIKAVCEERGWDKNTDTEKFLLFIEEVGEVAKAIRNHKGMYTEKKEKDTHQALQEELADVLNYLLDIANHFEIDLEEAYRNKHEINKKRTWGPG